MSKSLKKLIDINRLREFKNKLVGTDSAYVQTTAIDQTIAGTKTFSKPIVGSVTGSSGSCTGNAATATKATQDSDGNKITTTYSKNGHTHDDRYYTEAEVNNLLAGKANSSHTHPYIPTSASCNKNWHWKGQGGQPSWLWGGEDGTNMYVYNPSDFRVNYANSAGSAVAAANGVDSQGGNWIRFINGIQICWAKIPCGTSGASTWTYGASFSSTPVVTVCDYGGNTNAVYLTRAGNIGTTSCLIVMVHESNGSHASGEAQCIAIGRWK